MDELAPGTASSVLQWIGVAFVVGLAPFALICVTAYAKISIVLSFLQRALGLQQVPSAAVIAAISILLTTFVMGPVAADMVDVAAPRLPAATADRDAVVPLVVDTLDPLVKWLGQQTGADEREVFVGLGQELYPEAHRDLVAPDSLLVVAPAFLLTELKEAFVIGFLLFVPFVVIDFVVANILMSLGMQTLSPTAISLPFKLLLFAMIDGWTLLLQGLVLGYA